MNPLTGFLRPFEGVWSSDHPCDPFLEIRNGVVKVEQTLQLESTVERGILLQGHGMATRRGELYCNDPLLDDVRGYRRAPERASSDTSRRTHGGEPRHC